MKNSSIIIATIAVAGTIGGFFLVKKMKEKKQQQGSRNNNFLPPSRDSGGGNNSGGNLPVSPPASNNGGGNNDNPAGYFSATKVAEKLYNAMKMIGTDEDVILNELDKLKVGQLQQVIDAFGERKYFGGMANPVFGSPKSLTQWLKAELDSTEIEPVREIFIQHGINL